MRLANISVYDIKIPEELNCRWCDYKGSWTRCVLFLTKRRESRRLYWFKDESAIKPCKQCLEARKSYKGTALSYEDKRRSVHWRKEEVK